MSLYRAGAPARVYVGDTLASAVYKGTTEVWRRDPAYTDVSASGPVTVPPWAAVADVGVIGGGGGGATGDNGLSSAHGEGGNAAAWQTQTVAVTPGDVLTFTLGNGGPGGSGGVKKSGTAGGATTVTGPGLSLTSPGGTPGVGSTSSGDRTGHGAAAATLNGATFPPGTDVGPEATGTLPGGGGGGSSYKGWGRTPNNAAAGAQGRGRVRFRSY